MFSFLMLQTAVIHMYILVFNYLPIKIQTENVVLNSDIWKRDWRRSSVILFTDVVE